MLTKKYCCEAFRHHITHTCKEHPNPFECPDTILIYKELSKKVGIIIHDGGESYIQIQYCPWCGKKIKFK